jgi:GTP pyrophosphokinase/guanosine-3',5'-bis(diphosphate) 3'-pyrophosphohydrolase
VAAKVNGEPVALRTELKSGDVVEVSTSSNARPNPSWLNSVRTGRARSRIRHFLKNLEQEESMALGEKLLAQALRAEGMTMPADDPEHAAIWQSLTRWSGSRTHAELMVDIGLGRKIASIVAKRLAQLLGERGARPDAVMLTLGRYAENEAHSAQNLVEIDGTEGASVQLATCCRPIPGDEVTGYFGGEGLTVHTCDCSLGRRIRERDGERWMAVDWAEVLTRQFETGISVTVLNTKGALAQVAQAISTAEADITHIEMGDERAAESTELNLLVSVRDRLHLADTLRTLKRSPAVLRAARVKP